MYKTRDSPESHCIAQLIYSAAVIFEQHKCIEYIKFSFICSHWQSLLFSLTFIWCFYWFFDITCFLLKFHSFFSWRGVLDTTLCDEVCQWFVDGWWFSTGTPVSSTNKSYRYDITEILLKVALNAITVTPNGSPFTYRNRRWNGRDRVMWWISFHSS